MRGEPTNWLAEDGDSAWLPTRYTPSLTGTEQFYSDGPRLVRVVEAVWSMPGVSGPVVMDRWQRWFLNHVLEVYPPDWPVESLRGRLRYRQALLSLGRQNGKSFLAAVLGFYAMRMLNDGARVVGLASTADQANVVYDRVKYALLNAPKNRFAKEFKVTGWRGIKRLNKRGVEVGRYDVKPAKEDAVQGIALDMCILDEVHISKDELWNAAVNGMAGKEEALLLGLTTAGDEDSALLKRLYDAGESAMAGNAERFGFFLWEAWEGAAVDDPEAIKAANPAIACGRIPVDRILEDTKSEPEFKNRRFRLNQFIPNVNSWVSTALWKTCAGEGIPKDTLHPIVFAVDKSPSWEEVTITAATKVDGVVYTEVVARFPNAHIEMLTKECLELWERWAPQKFYMDSAVLKELVLNLRTMGVPVEFYNSAQMAAATETAYSLITERRVIHADQEALARQLPMAVTENAGDGYKVSRKKSLGKVDAVIATVIAIAAAENMQENALGVYFSA